IIFSGATGGPSGAGGGCGAPRGACPNSTAAGKIARESTVVIFPRLIVIIIQRLNVASVTQYRNLKGKLSSTTQGITDRNSPNLPYRCHAGDQQVVRPAIRSYRRDC